MPSDQAPNLFNFAIIATRLDTERFARVRLREPKPLGQIVQVVRDDHDLPIGDADKFVGVRRSRIAARFGVNPSGQLAIQVGHYQRKFGALPLEDAIDLLETKALNEDQAAWVADGLENLAVAIASVKDDDQPPTVQ